MSTSSRKCSGGDCVEVEFYKSTASAPNPNTCVEVAHCDCNEVRVRDSKNPTGPVLVFNHAEWDAFVAGVKLGEFDL